jgi:predicted Zn-dependent peptidase
VDVKAVNLAATLTEIEKEVHRIATEPITADELSSARRGYAANWNGQLQTAATASGPYLQALGVGKTTAELRADFDTLQAVDVAAVSRAAGKWLADDRPTLWILVGDHAAIDAELGKLGRTATWVPAADAMLGNF